ncbi:hypothetical protein HELRODRAFT_163297 [Helobdella robusta]|uniref:O-acyltransferase WSD1 C-terminal domain-containing protein n=1 Tax=Helobdella robusta TaxID=6412 RepID=T1ETV6_HELRO|nr:hypothetical protein HELRODRAFT_163297 [Helobdella robusta]ESN96251.1 hypothetical protein HELRODRAFT_163297 [Helobdella robusta]
MASYLASEPFDKKKPRWKVNFIFNYPKNLNTILFSCDPAMADGIYLMHVLQDALVDPVPLGFGRRHYGACNQDVDTFRSIIGGLTWFCRNFFTFKDKNKMFKKRKFSLQSQNLSKDEKKRNTPRVQDTSNQSRDSSLHDNTRYESNKRKLLVYGPITMQPFLTFRDVTRATLDELMLTLLTSSLREYLQHIHGFINPHDVAANISVALQNLLPQKRDPDNDVSSSRDQVESTSYASESNRSGENNNENHDKLLGQCDTSDTPSEDSQIPVLSPFSYKLSNLIAQKIQPSSPKKIEPHKSKRRKKSPIKKERIPSPKKTYNSKEILLNPLRLLKQTEDDEQTSVTIHTHIPSTQLTQNHELSRQNDEEIEKEETPQKEIRHLTTTLSTPQSPRKIIKAHRSFSNPNPSFVNWSSKRFKFLRSKNSKNDVDNENNNVNTDDKPIGFARTIATPPNLNFRPSAIHFTYVSNTNQDAKIEPGHMMFYKCCQILNSLLPQCIAGWLFRKIYGQPSVAYNSCIGPETQMCIDTKPIRNIFFWGPLKTNNCLGFSLMTYQSSITITLNANENLANPELIFDFFVKKLADLKELLKNRRVKHQPRFDTIFVPFSKMKMTKKTKHYLEDETGEKYEFRNLRASRKRSFYKQSKTRASMVTIATLAGPQNPDS